MGRDGTTRPEQSLAGPKGFPPHHAIRGWRTLRPNLAAVAAVVALAFAGLAASAVLRGSLYGGIGLDANETRVNEVFPGTFVWWDGIRPGQAVVELHAADESGGWRIATTGPEGELHSSETEHEAALQDLLPFALFALVAGTVAAVTAWRFAQSSLVLSILTVAVALMPIRAAAFPLPSTVAQVVVLGAPLLWLAASYRAVRFPIVAVAAVLSVLWVVTRFGPVQWFDVVDRAVLAAILLAVGAVVGHPILRSWRAEVRRAPVLSSVDLAVLGLAAGALIAGGIVFRLPLVALVVLAVLAAAIYPRSRRAVSVAVDRLFVSQLRESLSIDAVEAERERIAREIHDSPLQELTGVIHRLERQPGTAPEQEALQGVAASLRASAMNVRPPVLDDLGLGPAIEFLAEQRNADPAAFRVDLHVDSEGYLAGERPPIDVELAIFRIVQEAIANAERHSGADRVLIRGSITADRVELAVLDEGSGIPGHLIDGRGTRLGIASMRARAASIGARLAIARRHPSGTIVEIRWPR